MFDIITFGSATIDTFLKLRDKDYRILKDDRFSSGKSFCLHLGSKILIDDLKVSSGGGGTNTACTFSKQGFKVNYIGKVGDDKRGEELIEELRKFKIGTQFVKKDKDYPTAFSLILSSSIGERTALIYRGACHFMGESDIPWKELKKTRWFYLGSLTGKSSQIFASLVKFAKKNNIKVAANPGNSQINLGQGVLKPILSQLDVLILNEEEASLLTKISSENEKEMIKKLSSLTRATAKGEDERSSSLTRATAKGEDERSSSLTRATAKGEDERSSSTTKGIIVVTRGKKGSIVSDGKYIFEAGIPPVLAVEATGAGDAYGSGFLSGLLEKNNIEYAIQLATANATSCTQKIGAKNGLLQKGKWGPWPKVKVNKKVI
jgi:sugar/nucleoside kinase (ribokinase family)